MSIPLLSENDIKASISYAFVSLVAARAGFTCAVPMEADRDSIDAHIRAGGSMRPALDVQLKCTSKARIKGDQLQFQLKKKNFNDLSARRLIPAILLIYELPEAPDQWLSEIDEGHLLRRRAWWKSLARERELEQDSRLITIPSENRFNVGNLISLMTKISRGEEL